MSAIMPHGKTDPIIVREILKGFLKRDDVPRSEVDRVLEEYLRLLPQEVKESENYHVLKGVFECLDYLKTDERNILALATGNLERGSRIKLERAGLNEYFEFGGFASDCEERDKILAIAKQKAESAVKTAIPNDAVFVIGDTPRDIIACRQNGFRMIAVASGPFSFDELAKEKPEFLLESLEKIAGLPLRCL